MFVFTMILSLAGSSTAYWPERSSAASEAQIRFAEENKYDSTGPGAKTPEYAYRTYQTLEEALVAYANDPDTQLPEYEKNRALYNLVKPSYNSYPDAAPLKRYQPKTVDEYTGYKRPENEFKSVAYPPRNTFDFRVNDFGLIKNARPKEADYRIQKYQAIRGSPLSLGHYRRSQEHYSLPDGLEDFDTNPQYTFSYGVHDKGTGDSKSAHESRDGDSVRGYYTFLDADGKQRTVHYSADDRQGFRADVQRSHTNSQ